jgi:hypothetical protein
MQSIPIKLTLKDGTTIFVMSTQIVSVYAAKDGSGIVPVTGVTIFVKEEPDYIVSFFLGS